MQMNPYEVLSLPAPLVISYLLPEKQLQSHSLFVLEYQLKTCKWQQSQEVRVEMSSEKSPVMVV